MYRRPSVVLIMVASAWCTKRACAVQEYTQDPNERAKAKISLVELRVSQTELSLKYEITNGSSQDIWICSDMNIKGKWHFEVLLDDDQHRTLIVRRRLDVPTGPLPSMGPYGQRPGHPVGTYVHLEPGGRRVESLLLESPVQCRRILSRAQPTESTIHVDRLLVQIGFYSGDLPALIRDVLTKAEQSWETYAGHFAPAESQVIERLDTLALWQLNSLNKNLDDATDVVVIPYTSQTLKGERILQIAVDGVNIPCEETADSSEVLEGYSGGILSEARRGAAVNSRVEVGRWDDTWCLWERLRSVSDHDIAMGSDSLH